MARKTQKENLLKLKSALSGLDHDILLQKKKEMYLDQIQVLSDELAWKLKQHSQKDLQDQLMVHQIEESQLGQIAQMFPFEVKQILSCTAKLNSQKKENQNQGDSNQLEIEELLENLIVLKNAYHQLIGNMQKELKGVQLSKMCEVENRMLFDQVGDLHREIAQLDFDQKKEAKILQNIQQTARQEEKKMHAQEEGRRSIRLKMDVIDHFIEENWVDSFKFYLRNFDSEESLGDVSIEGRHRDSIHSGKSSLYEFSYMADQVDNHFSLDR